MYLTVRFVSQNLVTQTNFVGFRDIHMFHVFRDECLETPKNGIFKKILKVRKYFK